MQHQIPTEKHGALGPAMTEAVSTCVHCGFCLPACPTYQELGRETVSPRGRIILMKEVLEGTLPTEEALPHLDSCLGCLACEPACPSGVPYHQLISPFRAASETKRQRGWLDRFRRLLTYQTLPYPKRFRLAAKTGRIAKHFSALVPQSLRVMLDLLPAELPSRQNWNEINPAVGKRQARVALLTGCAQSVLDPDINTATIDVLTRNGVEVIVPQNQSCCGALSWHGGKHDQAAQFARHNLSVFPRDVDAILTNAAGCGSGMHEYNLILQGQEDADRIQSFCGLVQDVSVFLQQIANPAPIEELKKPLAIAYQDACHLANAQGVREQPRHLLRRIPGVTLVEISGEEFCCGSAGTYNIDQPEIAASLGKQKATSIVDAKAHMVASGNIGCITQIRQHLSRLGSDIPVRHTIQVLRDAYHGQLGGS